jgi:regulator of cell morphogenesis and NO signaling
MQGEFENKTLGEIVAQDWHKAHVLKKYGLDFCCGGKRSLKEACTKKGLDVTLIENELQQMDHAPTHRPLPFGDWSLDFLADYIVNTHHSYVRKNLPEIRSYAEKVLKVHGKEHPELLRIYQLIEDINEELTPHMFKEENILFPYIKELIAAKNNSNPKPVPHFGTVQNPIQMMETEHEEVGNQLMEIRELTLNFSLPEGACTTYNLLYKLLREFETDMHSHIHLENNILFPKALNIEKQFVTSCAM